MKSKKEPSTGYIKIPYMADNIMQFSLPFLISVLVWVYFLHVGLPICKIDRSMS